MTMNKILNTFYGIDNENISVLYHPSSRIFDAIIYSLQDIEIYVYKDIVQNYYYDIFFSNNFLMHNNETKAFCLDNHIKDLIGFHAVPPSTFKKEDISILHNNTNNTHKIFFGEDVASSWKVKESDTTSVIEYGIPKTDIDYYETKSDKVLILNLEKSQQIDMLYRNINSSGTNVDILYDLNMSLPDINKTLQQYDICLDFGNKINVLYCISRGIKCITPLDIDCPDMVYRIYNYNNITDIIHQALMVKTDYSTRKKSAELITKKYDYDIFKNRIVNKLQNIKTEIFKL